MARRWRFFAIAFLAPAAALALACGGADLVLPRGPARIAIANGNNQTAIVGGTLPESLVVRVTDSNGRPVAVQVAFALATPTAGGSITPDTATTDNNGDARARWVLGSQAGLQRANVSVVGADELTAEFSATASPGAVATFAIIDGDNQSAPVGTTLRDSLIVRAMDAAGNPVIGLLVAWSVTGGGSVSAPSVPTGTDGRAAVRRTLGPGAGTQTTLANAGDVPGSPLGFTATAVPAPPAVLAVVTQPASTAVVGVPFSRQPKIQLRDNLGNPVSQAGFAVSAALASGPAATLVGQRTQAADATGLAAFTDLAINGPPGTYTLRFSSEAGSAVTPVTSDPIELKIGAVSASRSTVSAQPSTITVFSGKSTITVTARDEQGNPVGGASVVPTSSDPGSSNFTPASAGTSGNGVATFTFSATAAKDYIVSARANGVQLNQTPTVKVKRASSVTTIRGFQPPSSTALAPVSVAFSVSGPSGGSPSGTVTVSDGSVSCSGTVAQGQCTLTPTTKGTKTFKASYLGDANFEPSSASQQHQIDAVQTALTLVSSNPFDPTVNDEITFTATVQAQIDVATGQVTFRENSCSGSSLGKGDLHAAGGVSIATLTRTLSAGTHQIFACYGGNQTFGPSENSLTQQVFQRK
jgi:hypothetical protein